MRQIIIPSDSEIIAELMTFHPIKRLATLRRLGRRCEMKHVDGDIIDAYEYLGAYFDSEGTRVGTAWSEYNPIAFLKSPIVIAIISIFFIAIVGIPAIADLISVWHQ
jgi:hypothetical protein